MKKLVVLMLFCGMSQALGSSENAGWEYASKSRQYSLSGAAPSSFFYEGDFSEDYQKSGFWNKPYRVSAEELAEVTDAMIEGLKSLATSLWNFITQ